MKKIISVILIAVCVAGIFTGCVGRIKKSGAVDSGNTNVVVTEDATKLRTKYGNIEKSTMHFIYEVVDPIDKQADGSDKIACSYEIYCNTLNLEEALSEKALAYRDNNGKTVIKKYADLAGGEWECYINGRYTKKDITKITIEEGSVYSFKYIIK